METPLDYGCMYRTERSTAKVIFQGEQCFFGLKSSAENSISLTDTFVVIHQHARGVRMERGMIEE